MIIFNNDGGGIFSFLPIAQYDDVFTTYFQTPHGLSFGKAAEMFDLFYAQPQTRAEFEKIYWDVCEKKRSAIIEVKTEKETNVRLHRDMKQIIQSLIDSDL